MEKLHNYWRDKLLSFPELIFDVNQYKLIRKLGAGGSGCAMQFENNETGELVVIKYYYHVKPKSDIDKGDTLKYATQTRNGEVRTVSNYEECHNEMKLLMICAHENIVKLLGVCVDEDKNALLMLENADFGDLSAFMSNNTGDI